MLNRFFATLFMLSATVGCTFVSMIYGWGVMPKRVWVVIAINVFVQGLVQLFLGIVIKPETKPDGKA